MNLKILRSEIDSIDEQIMFLLNARFNIVNKIKDYKQSNKIAILDTKREQAIFNRIESLDSEYNENIKVIYKVIMDESKRRQEEGE